MTASPESTPADRSVKEPQETEVAPGSSEAAKGAKSAGEEVTSSDKMDDGMNYYSCQIVLCIPSEISLTDSFCI